MIRSLVRRLVGQKPQPEFSHRELIGLFAAFKDAEIETLPVQKFAKRMIRRRESGKARKQGFGVLRFDIHGNVERSLRVAEALSEYGLHGVFLTMHRHPVNEGIYDSPVSWVSLKRIADLGHEIGLHFDPFYLIRAHGSLYTGLRVALAEMRQRGFEMNVASVHGDTRAHIKACGLQANDFFEEGHRATRWNGEPPKEEEFLAEHVRRYSQAKIANQLGLVHFAEPNFTQNGELICDEPTAYLSDNRRQLRVNNLTDDGGPERFLMAPEPLRISRAFAQEVAAALRERPFLALFHPQWYA